jgi:protein-disulfide isomerase
LVNLNAWGRTDLNRRCLSIFAQICPILLFALILFGCKKPEEQVTSPPSQQQSQQQPAPTQPSPQQLDPPQQAPQTTPSSQAPAVKKAPATTPPPAPATQTSTAAGDIDPHQAFGSKNAPVVMEVFSDFQCPACKTLFLTTNRLVMDNYVSTGQVYLIHRDFPLPMHAYSRVAARYARAAAQIGKFEPVEQVLFQNQEKWEQTGDVDGTIATVLSPADMAKVRALVKSGTLDAGIDKDTALGQIYRVSQTPTTIFHSKGQTYPYSGVMTYDILKQFLDQLLSQR